MFGWDYIQDQSQVSASMTGVGPPYSGGDSEVHFGVVSQGQMLLKQSNNLLPCLCLQLCFLCLWALSSPFHEKLMGIFLLSDSQGYPSTLML